MDNLRAPQEKYVLPPLVFGHKLLRLVDIRQEMGLVSE